MNELLRLGSANPVPTPAPAGDPALFARITAEPADARLQRAAPRRRRVVVGAIAFAALVLASTAFAVGHWVLFGAVKPKVTASEYLLAQRELTLPPASSWPKLHLQADSVTSRGAGGGYAVAIAQNAWECYWVDAIRTGDAAAAQRAQAELDDLLTNHVIVAPADASENWTPPHPPKQPFAVFADDGGLQWKRETYALAAAGHSQRLDDSCRANAPG